jgi:hypothetical protein
MATHLGRRRISLSTGSENPVRGRKVTRDDMSIFRAAAPLRETPTAGPGYRSEWDSTSAISIDDATAYAVRDIRHRLPGSGSKTMTSRMRSGIGVWLCLSVALCLAVGLSSRTDPGELGAPVYWTWALTGLQVMALWVAGRGHAWGWMVGSAVQPGWIAYALLTNQLGFVFGCVISTGVQLSAYLRADGSAGRPPAIPIAVRRGPGLELRAASSGHPA